MNSPKKATIIDLISGPGAGKTTMAHAILSKLKMLNKTAEYASEYAKELVRERNYTLLDNQHYVSYQQYLRIKQYENLEYIVTDGSLLLGMYYNYDNKKNICDRELTKEAILKWHNEFNHIIIFIERSPDHPYEQEGRYQDYERAKLTDIEMENMLNELGIDFYKVVSDEKNIGEIIKHIMTYPR